MPEQSSQRGNSIKADATLTRISLPVKVVRRLTRAFLVDLQLIACRAVGEGDMVIANLIEEMNLFLLQGQGGGDGVDRSIAPSFVEEAAILVEGVEKVCICLGTEPVGTGDFKIRPLRTVH